MRLLETAAREAHGKHLLLLVRLFGADCEVYAPKESTSVYDEEDQAFDYDDTPDFAGRMLITGLNELRFGGHDDWNPSEVKLFTPGDSSLGYIPQENAKIVVTEADNVFNLRVLNKRAVVGQHIEIAYEFELVGFN